jgi:hypothetical protein
MVHLAAHPLSEASTIAVAPRRRSRTAMHIVDLQTFSPMAELVREKKR